MKPLLLKVPTINLKGVNIASNKAEKEDTFNSSTKFNSSMHSNSKTAYFDSNELKN